MSATPLGVVVARLLGGVLDPFAMGAREDRDANRESVDATCASDPEVETRISPNAAASAPSISSSLRSATPALYSEHSLPIAASL